MVTIVLLDQPFLRFWAEKIDQLIRLYFLFHMFLILLGRGIVSGDCNLFRPNNTKIILKNAQLKAQRNPEYQLVKILIS